MNIPVNGRIAIVDDKFKEVKPLINLLSKKRIPFNYYTGLKAEELPENADSNPVTIIFLDLNIVESQHNARSVISTLHPILKALCPLKCKPYIIVIWSKKINDFANELESHFTTSVDLRSRKPIKFIRLDKTDYFHLNEEGEYLFDDSKYDTLKEQISNELDGISILKNFLLWENLVHHQTTETVGEFSSFFQNDAEWNVNTKALLFHLAKSIVGNDEIARTNDSSKLALAFNSINSFLADQIQGAIIGSSIGDVSELIDDTITRRNPEGRLKNGVRGKINAKLHLVNNTIQTTTFEQGNVYKLKNEHDLLKRILFKEKYGEITRKDISKTKPSLLQLDLTPVCDYSQDKNYTRTVYGVLLDAKFSVCFNTSILPSYQQRTPIFFIDKKERFMLFDFRFIATLTKKEIEQRHIVPFLKLRKEICTDIQSQLSSQVNRPGISNV